jgi:hypothetical protein
MQGECPDSAMVVKTLVEAIGDDIAEFYETSYDTRPEVATDSFDFVVHDV